jgi:hypothetical protein
MKLSDRPLFCRIRSLRDLKKRMETVLSEKRCYDGQLRFSLGDADWSEM